MFRSIGFAELVIIAVLILLFMGGKRISGLFTRAGESLREGIDKGKWLFNSLGGTEEEEIRDEEKVGRDLARRFLEECPASKDGDAQVLVSSVGSQLVQCGPGEQRNFAFVVVESPVVNAFALPGGNIFVTRPLLDLCLRDRDEVAFLLAHEIGHITGRHAAEHFQVDTILQAVRVGGMVKNLMDKGYSRQQETEADLAALALLKKAGFDEEGAFRLLRKLEGVDPTAPELSQYFSTHPETAERISAVREYLAKDSSGA